MFCPWLVLPGGSELSFFFLLSGFVLAYQYSDRRDVDTLDFWLKRVVRLYPTYLLTLGLSCVVLPWHIINAKPYLPVLVPGLSAWVPFAFTNPLNTPGWAVGAFLFLYAFTPAALELLSTSGEKTRWRYLVPFCFLCTAWAAVVDCGTYIMIFDPLNRVLFSAHVPTFVRYPPLSPLFSLSSRD